MRRWHWLHECRWCKGPREAHERLCANCWAGVIGLVVIFLPVFGVVVWWVMFGGGQ